MTVTDVRKDTDTLTMTITAEFDASVEQVWQLWANPRKLERWWGPPTYPATVIEHNLVAGGSVRYFMTSPEGEKYPGWWKITSVDAPTTLVFEDGFEDENGQPNLDMPVTVSTVTVAAATDTKTTMRIKAKFPSLESMEQLIAMGMEEGITLAVGQADAIVNE